jgi:hypothetical protein
MYSWMKHLDYNYDPLISKMINSKIQSNVSTTLLKFIRKLNNSNYFEEVSWPLTLRQEIPNIHISN